MLKQETKTIDGETYRVTQLGFKRGQKLLVRLIKALGPVVAEGLGNLPKMPEGTELGDVEVSSIAPGLSSAISELAERLSEDDLEFVTSILAESTMLGKGGERWVQLAPEMEIHFAGRYRAYIKWLWFALGVNYSDFFPGLQSVGNVLGRVAGVETPGSPSQSTGTSTESPPPSDTPQA